MLTQVEAEVGIDGSVLLLEPLRLKKRSRAIVTIIDTDPIEQKQISEEDARSAEDRFERHFGAVESGDPNSADNEKIDADLAMAYSDAHDE